MKVKKTNFIKLKQTINNFFLNFYNKFFGIDGRLDKYYSRDDKEIISNYKTLLQQKQEHIQLIENQFNEKYLKLTQDLTLYQNLSLTLQKEIAFLKQELDTKYPIPINYYNLRLLFDKKYPYSIVKYKGRPIKYLVSGKERIFVPDVHVSNYIYDFVELRTYLVERGLTWEEYYKNKYKSFSEAMDSLREDIYEELTKMINYRFDVDLFGDNENWSGSWISYYLTINGKRYMDCEDSSFLLMALFKASGMPRGFQRAVCGDTKLGGHCAVHCYNFKKDIWEHFETTSQKKLIFPAKDTRNIAFYNIWFSFDWEYSWSKESSKLLTEKINSIQKIKI